MITACPACKVYYVLEPYKAVAVCPCGSRTYEIVEARILLLSSRGYKHTDIVEIPPDASLAAFTQGQVVGVEYVDGGNGRRPAVKHLEFSTGIKLWLGSGAGEAVAFAATRPLE